MNNDEGENFSFVKYVERIKKIGKNNPQERNYQELISAFLNKILIKTDIEVIDVSANRNTSLHSRNAYTGIGGTPDLLLARGYQYENKVSEELGTEYIAAIEIKAFNERYNESKLIQIHKQQLESHLSKNKKVIFTDCVTWCFLKKDEVDKKEEFMPVKSFKLNINFNESDYLGTEPKEWNELQNYIREFILN